VRLVAVIPTRTELWLLEDALEPEPAAVERCAEAGLLVIDEEAVAFRHELLRQAVEGSLSALGRRSLHRRVLQVLSDAQGRGVDIARLVHHARHADDADAVLRYAPEAARQAAAVAAHREAVGHYRAALPHAGRLDPLVRAELLEAYSVEAYLSGLPADAVSARQAAVAIREAAGDQEKVGDGLRWLSRVSWWAGQRKGAEAAAARAIAVLERGEPGHQLAMAYSNQAQLDMLAYRTESALEWASRAIELARRLGDQETLTHALTNIGTAKLARELDGRPELEQAFDVAIAAGLDDHAARALVNLAASAVEVRDHRHARDAHAKPESLSSSGAANQPDLSHGCPLVPSPEPAQREPPPEILEPACGHARFVDRSGFLVPWSPGHHDGAQAQVDAMLGNVCDLGRVDEPRSAVGIDHQPVEDVFLLHGEDSLDGSDAPALSVVYRGPWGQGFIGDRTTGLGLVVHRPGR
jgi:tetratricopeptide (TPR) repeat protein